MVLTLGMKADTDLVVGAGDMASAMMSGDVDVLATPRLVALLEAAAVAAVRDVLADHQTTVGSHIDLRHLAPSPIGSRIVASAELVAVEGRRLTFRVTAVMGDELVGEGTHTRVIVDRDRFGS